MRNLKIKNKYAHTFQSFTLLTSNLLNLPYT